MFTVSERAQRYQDGLLAFMDGEVRPALATTGPAVAAADATNLEMGMARDEGRGGYVLNGRKWFASNAMHQNCRVLIVMGKTDPIAAPHRQQSMMVVPLDAPG